MANFPIITNGGEAMKLFWDELDIPLTQVDNLSS